jgi:hypothetical protein
MGALEPSSIDAAASGMVYHECSENIAGWRTHFRSDWQL